MVEKISHEECTGCSACAAGCPVNAITMKPDEHGFLHPQVDVSVCVHCGRCLELCPLEKKNNQNEERKAYAVVSNDANNRYVSTSGGAFTEIARQVIKRGGVVAGARYEKDFLVGHYMVTTQEELACLRQSKYLQSDKKDIFKLIKTKLDAMVPVLFVGSPCEAAGLVSYLGKEYEHLLICDYICKGSNSPKVFRLFLDELEKKYHGKITNVWFKNKEYTWNRFSTRIDFDNGKKYHRDRYHDWYMRGYLEENLYVRESCGQCHFKRENRFADITLADFWGIEHILSDIDTSHGVSLVITNTSKGSRMIDALSDTCFVKECEYHLSTDNNYSYVKSVVRSPNTEAFYRDLDQDGFHKTIKKYLKPAWKHTVKRKWRTIKSFIKKLLCEVQK